MFKKDFPVRFIERIKNILPEGEQMDFFTSMATPLRKSIRVNTLRISILEFQKLAEELGWELSPIPWCESGFWIDRPSHAVPLGKSWAYAAGLFYIQEAASMLPPELLLRDFSTKMRSHDRACQDNLKILDMAAAPGSKTTQLAALIQNQGVIIANEPLVKRIKSLSHNLEHQGVATALLTRKDGSAFAKYLPNTLDKILLDAPCTGEGTVRKDPRALVKFSENRIQEMARLQFRLAVAAFHCLRPDGELVYSTCTLAPEENEGVISKLLNEFGKAIELIPVEGANGVITFQNEKYDPRVAGCRRLWPHRENCEGFFAAKLRKLENTKTSLALANVRRAASPFRKIPTKRAREFICQLEKWFGREVHLPREYSLWQRDSEVWLRPDLIESWASRLDFERTGNRILKLNREGKIIRVTHLGASSLLGNATRHVVELDEEQRDEFLAGRDIKIVSPPIKGDLGGLNSIGGTPLNPPLSGGMPEEGQCVIRHRNYFLGLGLLRDEKIKNQLPREFVI